MFGVCTCPAPTLCLLAEMAAREAAGPSPRGVQMNVRLGAHLQRILNVGAVDHIWLLWFMPRSKNTWLFFGDFVFLVLKEVNQTLEWWIATFDKKKPLHIPVAFCPEGPVGMERATAASQGRLPPTGPVCRTVPTLSLLSLLSLLLMLAPRPWEDPDRALTLPECDVKVMLDVNSTNYCCVPSSHFPLSPGGTEDRANSASPICKGISFCRKSC